LTGLKLDLSSLGRAMSANGLAGECAAVKTMERNVGDIIRTVQKISTELRPGVLDELGLAAAVEWQAKDFQSRTGIGCEVSIYSVGKTPDILRSTTIFRIFQETLTNVIRHAEASQVWVCLETKEDELIFELRDNGIGIAEEPVSDPRSLGLLGIRERVQLLGGRFLIGGKPGEGTLVKVTLPLES
jgi:signal transduction histidine kinase